MALQIEKDKDGKVIKHWDIVRLYFNVDEKHLIAELRGYETKEKRDEAKTGAKTAELIYQFTLSGSDFPDVTKRNWINDVFQFIKRSTLYGGWDKAKDV